VSVSGADDVNNDGYADLIVGANGNDAGGSDAGRAYVYSGQTGALLYTFTGEAANDWFGFSVSGAGDVNKDGYADLIVGAYRNDAGGNNAGRAYVYSGQAGTLLYTFTGEAAVDSFGVSVSGAGDVNNDGYADLIVGASGNDAGGSDAGRAYVYGGMSGSLLCSFDGQTSNDEFGVSVSGAGDVNNDGYDEVIAGAAVNDAGGSDAGRAYVFACQEPEPYICGDVNGDTSINLADVICLANYILKGGSCPIPVPIARANANGDTGVNLADVIYLANNILKGGTAPHDCGNYGS
jgi:large repetitive protein